MAPTGLQSRSMAPTRGGSLLRAEVAAGSESPVIPIDAAASLGGNRENK